MTFTWSMDPRFRDMRSFADLRALTIAWLRGEVADLPTYGGGPDSETDLIRDELIACNQRRLLTVFSQPGVTGQRACLAGVAPHAVADRVWQAANRAGLIAIVTAMDEPFDPDELPNGVPITIWQGNRTQVTPNHVLNRGDFTTYAARGIAMADEDIAAAGIEFDTGRFSHVEVIDATWERSTYLFDVVVDALATSGSDRS